MAIAADTPTSTSRGGYGPPPDSAWRRIDWQEHLPPTRSRELIPDARKLVYEDTGHVAMLERPERFNRDVEAFLAS